MKIIQILLTPEDARWQGRLLGLGDDGILYESAGNSGWYPMIPCKIKEFS